MTPEQELLMADWRFAARLFVGDKECRMTDDELRRELAASADRLQEALAAVSSAQVTERNA